MGRMYSMHGEHTSAYRVLVGKPEGTRLVGRPRYRREDNTITCMSVIIDEFWIDGRIYWTL
jgi:hypothetical protein